MANITVYRASDKFVVDVGDGKVYNVPSDNFQITETGATTLRIIFDPLETSTKSWQGSVSEVLDKDGVAYGTAMQDIHRGIGSGIDVTLQDQTTPVVLANFNQIVAQTTTSQATAIDDTDVEVTSATGIVVGHLFTLFNATEERFFFAHVLTIVSTTITIDTPLDFAFPSGTFIDSGIDDLAVNGSSTPQVFGLRGGGTPEGVDLDFDCVQLSITCQTTSASNLAKFGNLTALANGLVFRRRDGTHQNIFNVKSNSEINEKFTKFEFFVADPPQGQDGFGATIVFGGQDNYGVVLRIGAGEDLEIIVQDDLSTLTSLKIMAKGSIVKH